MGSQVQREPDSPPGRGGKALHHIIAELLRGEVTVFEKRAGLDLDVTDRSEFLNEGAEGVEGGDGLSNQIVQ